MEEHFQLRHIGPGKEDLNKMLSTIGVDSLDELIDRTIPDRIRLERELKLGNGMTEYEYLNYLRELSFKNKLYKTYIGLGYYASIMPAVIQRNILENPSWYTSYTPYQAEISQGRLEALLNFQTMVMELTGMELANASLLDEPTAAAEAMSMLFNARGRDKVKSGANRFFVDNNIFPQTRSLLLTRAQPIGVEIIMGDYREFKPDDRYFGLFIQYPAADGKIGDYSELVRIAAGKGIATAVAADLLSLTLLVPPGEWGADVVVGSTQRFGIPMGYGGPHAAYFAARDSYKRQLPGRIIGVSVDRHGNPALRMALQTREQHIRREKATSNICTAQALLATMAGMYGAWHGPGGLTEIAGRIHSLAVTLEAKLAELGYSQENTSYFDTLKIVLPGIIKAEDIRFEALKQQMNFAYTGEKTVQISLDETTGLGDLNAIIGVFAIAAGGKFKPLEQIQKDVRMDDKLRRTGEFMRQEVFYRYRSETEMMRYIKKLERRDFSLTDGMISLGSCTMKLNAAAEMLALSWPEFTNLHPFVPADQAEGYQQLFNELGNDLKEITGFQGISFMPNSGASGEYTGLLVIRAYHEKRGDTGRNICLIPASAHGTNPASAVMAGMNVVVVGCDERGNIRLDELRSLATEHKDTLAAFMVTYPSTHGVFEEDILEMTRIIHDNGGLVYMDGANMNAQVGFTNPAKIGADVCHLNLHKTFAIPHGGGGPGMGPIAVADHLIEFLPAHPVIPSGGVNGIGAVAGAPWGSASILTISHAYIKLLGGNGLREATRYAILNANYLAYALKKYYDVLYTGKNGYVGHEMILDCRNFKAMADISEADIAKRLMDYGFHAPTLSFPVHGTLMVEPTESEPLTELDRFVDAMVSIFGEIQEVAKGEADREDNVLKNAPHTVEEVAGDQWNHPYSREKAAYPLPWITGNKFWPAVARLDEGYGDRNLVCSCLPLEAYRNDE
jgi:glycine dehydrogenase